MKEIMAATLANQTAILGTMKSGFATRNEKAAEVTFNWTQTHTGTDVANFILLSTEVIMPESEGRDTVVQLVHAAVAFLAKADRNRDRKAAGLEFEKKVRKIAKGLDEEAVELLVEAVEPLANPAYVKARGLEEGTSTYKYGGRAYTKPAATTEQPAAAGPTAYAAPPGYQLVPYAQTAAATSPAAGAGGGAPKPRVGQAQLDPSKVYPPAHFAKPCTYCAHPAHSGDGCWKTFPALRALNL